MKEYRLFIPTMAGCLYCHALNKKEAKQKFKNKLCLSRMPNGYKIFLHESRKV